MLKILKCFLFFMTFASALVQSSDYNTNSTENSEIVNTSNLQKKISNYNHDLIEDILIDVAQIEALELVVLSMATIIHELGHAAAVKSLFELYKPTQIYIGTITPEITPKLFSLKNMHFYKTMPWTRGMAMLNPRFKKDQPFYNNVGRGIVHLAGGLSGAALMYVLLSSIVGCCAHCDNKGLFETSLKSLVNAISPFSYILKTKKLSYKNKRFLLNATLVICLSFIYQLFYACTPYRSYGDGITMWRKNIGVTGTPLKIARGLSILGIGGAWMFLIKKYCDARKQLSEEDSKTAIFAGLGSWLLLYMQKLRHH